MAVLNLAYFRYLRLKNSFVDTSSFFMVIAASALVIFGIVQLLEEPEGHMAEALEDGSVQVIELT